MLLLYRGVPLFTAVNSRGMEGGGVCFLDEYHPPFVENQIGSGRVVVLDALLFWTRCLSRRDVVLDALLFWTRCSERAVVLYAMLFWTRCCSGRAVVLDALF